MISGTSSVPVASVQKQDIVDGHRAPGQEHRQPRSSQAEARFLGHAVPLTELAERNAAVTRLLNRVSDPALPDRSGWRHGVDGPGREVRRHGTDGRGQRHPAARDVLCRPAEGVWSFVLDPVSDQVTRLVMLSLSARRSLAEPIFWEPAHVLSWSGR